MPDHMLRILLVEDNEMNSDMLSRRLRRRGFEVVEAADGEQACLSARELRPDLILMDMSLPVMDGCMATRRIRACPATAGIPVIALTAHAMAQDREVALGCGCDDYDTKPVDLIRLLQKMNKLLNAQARQLRDGGAPVEQRHLREDLNES